MEDKKIEQKGLEENLDLVNYIMLHRIYDMLTIIANKIVGTEDVSKMVNYHKEGYLIGPPPAYSENIDYNL